MRETFAIEIHNGRARAIFWNLGVSSTWLRDVETCERWARSYQCQAIKQRILNTKAGA